MPKKITNEQRQAVLSMLAQGHDRFMISEMVGVTPGQVSAVSAHVKMGTYSLPELTDIRDELVEATPQSFLSRSDAKPQAVAARNASFRPILLGPDAESNEPVYWNPDPNTGAVNPHVLILGESGFGKTYTISCLLAELAQRNVTSIVFDYGQGFALESAPKEFIDGARPIEIQASRDGIDINPLQIFSSDVLGPLNVAQRVADTFSRVYPKLGVQQHAVLRQVVLDVLTQAGISVGDDTTWSREPPAFSSISEHLQVMAADPTNPHSSVAATVASHISTMFVFNTFRPSGFRLAWPTIFRSDDRVVILQLKGLEYSLERAVTEFLLWNLIGYVESGGPSSLQAFVVLDEAHRLSFDRGSPVEKLLREGRKFGLGLLLASQQPEDFGAVAYGNTATKLVFQVSDDKAQVSRQLFRKMKTNHSFAALADLITKLPRGLAYVVSENRGNVVRIASFDARTFSKII